MRAATFENAVALWKRTITEALRAANDRGCGVDFDFAGMRPVWTPDPNSAAYALARAVHGALFPDGEQMHGEFSAGGSDTQFASGDRIDAMGPRAANVHKEGEFVDVTSVTQRGPLLATMIAAVQGRQLVDAYQPTPGLETATELVISH